MARNLPLLLVRNFIPLLIRAIGFIVIMMITAIFAVLRGVWEQSDFIANSWLVQVAHLRLDSRFDSGMYWAVRITVVFLLLVIVEIVARLIWWMVLR